MTSGLLDAKTPGKPGVRVTPLTAVTSEETGSAESLTTNERPRRKWGLTRVHVAAGLAFVGFAVVLSAIESLAVRGQMDFGRFELGLTDPWTATPAVALEAGALTFAGLALWATLRGRRAMLARLMTIATVMAAAGASWVGGRAAGRPVVGAAYLAAASVMALMMWHLILHQVRSDDLQATGQVSEPAPPRPRFGAARWLVDFRGTLKAWKLAVLRRISDAGEALDAVRAAEVAPIELSADVVIGLSARDRLAVAFGTLGRVDVPAALAMLRDLGAGVDQSYAYQLIKQMGLKRDGGAADRQETSKP